MLSIHIHLVVCYLCLCGREECRLDGFETRVDSSPHCRVKFDRSFLHVLPSLASASSVLAFASSSCASDTLITCSIYSVVRSGAIYRLTAALGVTSEALALGHQDRAVLLLQDHLTSCDNVRSDERISTRSWCYQSARSQTDHLRYGQQQQ